MPIGNVEDLSPRAKKALTEAELIFCEDSRKTQELFRRINISNDAKWVSLPGSREKEVDFRKWTENSDARSWVFLSDAGTPIVNDPGHEILEFCRQEGVPVEAIPGPCAPILAWQWSGGFGLPFVFAGFAPKAKSSDSKNLEDFFKLALSTKTFAFFDTRHQIEITLDHLAQSPFKDSKIWIAREMTKAHEELISGTAKQCMSALKPRLDSGDGVGELTLILEGLGEPESKKSYDISDLVKIRNLPPKQAAKIVAELTGQNSAEIYKAFIEAKLRGPDSE